MTGNKRYNIYIYLWEEFNTVYIGRTVNPKSRHYQHRHIPTETTYKFSSEHHAEHPKMIIIENDLSVEDGIEREKYWINEYRENSPYEVLNKTKGGETGNYGSSIKWTKESVFEESKKHKTKVEFKRGNDRAYRISIKKGWINEMEWLRSYSKYTKEEIFEVSRKYNSRNEFKHGSPMYQIALKNKWLDEMEWLKPKKQQKNK